VFGSENQKTKQEAESWIESHGIQKTKTTFISPLEQKPSVTFIVQDALFNSCSGFWTERCPDFGIGEASTRRATLDPKVAREHHFEYR